MFDLCNGSKVSNSWNIMRKFGFMSFNGRETTFYDPLTRWSCSSCEDQRSIHSRCHRIKYFNSTKIIFVLFEIFRRTLENAIWLLTLLTFSGRRLSFQKLLIPPNFSRQSFFPSFTKVKLYSHFVKKKTPVWRQRSEKAAMSKFLLFKSFQTITTKYTKLVPFVDVVLWWFILQTQCQGWNWNCKTSNAIVKPRLTHSWVRKRWKQTTVWMCGKRPQQKPNKCLRVTCLLSEFHPSTGRMCTLNRSETCFVYILRESRVEWTWETYALHIFRIAKAVASTPSIADPRRATSPSAIVKSLSSHQFE